MLSNIYCIEPIFDMVQAFTFSPVKFDSIVSPTVRWNTSEIIRMMGDTPSEDYQLARIILRNELTVDWYLYPIIMDGRRYRLCSPYVPYSILAADVNSDIVLPVTIENVGSNDEYPGYVKIKVRPIH